MRLTASQSPVTFSAALCPLAWKSTEVIPEVRRAVSALGDGKPSLTLKVESRRTILTASPLPDPIPLHWGGFSPVGQGGGTQVQQLCGIWDGLG